MIPALKALSALLCYPDAELMAALPEVRAAIRRDPAFSRSAQSALDALCADLAACDLLDAQANYVDLFDRTRSLSLHLFEHVYGEGRDRGGALVDLKAVYETVGFEAPADELPDFLPMFAEFCATRTPDEARKLLAEPAHVIEALAGRLRKRGSPYAAALDALAEYAGAEISQEAELLTPTQEPRDFAGLDAAWEETAVSFGPGAATNECGGDALTARLRHARRAVPTDLNPSRAGAPA